MADESDHDDDDGRTLRASILIDPERPKVKREEALRILAAAGIQVARSRPDVGVVVGGDGIFSDYGRRISKTPLLFVGVRSAEATASRGYLAQVHIDRLPEALRDIKEGRFEVVEYRRLRVAINGVERGEVFTDVYLEKGADSNCLRYHLDVKPREGHPFTDSAIANGVVISTSAGSTGYYSYVDRVHDGDRLEPGHYTRFGPEEVGVCHIAPVLTARSGTDLAPLRYTVPWGASFRLRLTRDADARLYGIVRSRRGIRVRTGDLIDVRPSASTTRVVRLSRGSG